MAKKENCYEHYFDKLEVAYSDFLFIFPTTASLPFFNTSDRKSQERYGKFVLE